MKTNYIPEVLKEKLSSFYRYSYALLLFLVSIFSAFSLFTFDINDNSFLTSTNSISGNLFGDIGSYFASFIFYTFGLLGYLIVLFFLIYSVLTIINKQPKYIFIRLLLFFISLIFIPQTLLQINFQLMFIDSIETWGVFAKNLNSTHNFYYLNYFLSLIGFLIFLFSQNIFVLFKKPNINLKNIFKITKKGRLDETQIKKDPIINNVLNTYEQDIKNVNDEKNEKNSKLNTNYLSPSLDILETNNEMSKNKGDSETIKANSELLESVFEDFNIKIQVVNVKLGPVVTLFEILPAAGIKINTIINLADDISRSMGVGAVRI